jgi:hypothetical protein
VRAEDAGWLLYILKLKLRIDLITDHRQDYQDKVDPREYTANI